MTSLCALALLSSGCGKKRHDAETDAAMDPSSDPCMQDATACRGAIQIELNTCPKISILATPLHIAPGDKATLTVSIFDAEGNTVTQEWHSDPDGKVDMTAPNALFECESFGRKTVTLVATDEHDCATTDSVEVVCIQAQQDASVSP